MTCTYSLLEDNYLCFEIDGIISLAEVAKYLDKLKTFLNQPKSQKILITITAAQRWLSTGEMIETTRLLEKEGISHNVKVAIFRPRSYGSDMLTTHKFYSDYFNNRGWKLEFFYEKEKALDWLMS
jgi:hypothetical protein